ncbi:uncharacterized protein LOC100846538 isoform X2 [Brachypodium distachyon]|uniref:uncharacterized protein LOC100846538 isoform X2 n=1 Tax=Brachypodium distachyon TaxID=15368 RepID=UPI000D0D3BF8|nr:uncharacterized protein LOC100846538 isoform X2 [Brachypodium distachyon]|eukprot:XP_024313901.1 uncharacterized protein LOC100846538 isoform X2 [Brachypodium distachyon]
MCAGFSVMLGIPASSVPMKKLIDEEFSKDVNARHTSPGAVGRLMGLDSLPSFRTHNQHRYSRSHAPSTSASISHHRYVPQRRSTDEVPEVKDVFEVMDVTRIKVHRSPGPRNRNVTSKFDTTDNADLDFVRQKFMDAKCLSTNGSFQMSEELNETLDALASNKELLLEFLQKLDPVVRRDLQDQDCPSNANCITVLKPSRRNQVIDTDNSYPQDQGTVKHSTRKPHAKLSSRSPKEDSGSTRQKLSRSSHQEISDKRACPTRIVVLKPSLEKGEDIEGSFALTHEFPHSVYRRQTTCQDAGTWSPYTEESMCQVSLGDPETLGHRMKGSREIAREITKQMRAARRSGNRKQVPEPDTSTNVSDERSQLVSSRTKVKTSDTFHRSSELCDGWASSSSHSSPARATETSVSKEAKRHLSSRWKMAHQYQHQAPENSGFGVLEDMFALSDQEASKVATETMPYLKCPKGELQRDRIPGSCNNPLGISSKDGWRGVTPSNLTKSKSLPSSSNLGAQKSSSRKRSSRRNEFSMLKDVLRVGPHDSEYTCRSRQKKSTVRGSTIHVDDADQVSPDNKERIMVERQIDVSSLKPSNVIDMPDSSEQNELDALYHLHTSSVVLEQKKEPFSPAKLKQQSPQQPLTALDCHLLVPSLDNLVTQAEGMENHQGDDYSAPCNPATGSESSVGADHHPGAGNQDQSSWVPPAGSESPVSSNNNDDQPSPVSVLESSLDTEEVYSGDFDKISADLQGLRVQLQLLKMDTTDNADGTNVFIVSDDENTFASQPLPEMEISHAFRDDEERDFSYVLDMLILLGINAADQDVLLDTCYFSECPASPDLYDILEDKYNNLILWPSSERKLLFDLTNAVIADVMTSLVHHGAKRLLQGFSSIWDQEGFVVDVWQRVVQLRQEMDRAQEDLSVHIEWLGSEDGIDLVGSEIGRMLHEDLLEETIAEFLGLT